MAEHLTKKVQATVQKLRNKKIKKNKNFFLIFFSLFAFFVFPFYIPKQGGMSTPRVGNFFLHAACFSASRLETSQLQQKSLREIYFLLRASVNKCKLTANDFLVYAEKAIVAQRCSETLWAVQHGLKTSAINQEQKYKLLLLQGRAFLCLNRTEEAISTLKKIVQNKKLYTSKEFNDIAFSAHLVYIKAYYVRANKKKDANVIYLLNLLKKRYPKKSEISLTNNWQKNN